MLLLADPGRACSCRWNAALGDAVAPGSIRVDAHHRTPQCGHGAADLLLHGTLVEVKSGRGTEVNTVLTGAVIHQLLGYVLSVRPELEESGSITPARVCLLFA